MGDPRGLGPELLIQLFDDLDKVTNFPLLVIGDYQMLKSALDKLGAAQAKLRFKAIPVVNSEKEVGLIKKGLKILNLSNLKREEVFSEPGSKRQGRASLDYIDAGVRLCKRGICSGMVTLPVSKSALLRAGCPYPGHTELLAKLDGAKQVLMMMVLDEIRVGLLTHHIPLGEVVNQIEPKKILSILKLMNRALAQDFGIKNPSIGVLGVNPHSGEDGKIGDEEKRLIEPAIRKAQKLKMNVIGPVSGDSAFHRAKIGEFDALLAMYHDQGLAPLKTLNFERVVNVTLGLSFVRTSPGHGTAYDIAWKGIASPESFYCALRLAERLIKNRAKANGRR